mgnify:FL=1|jgi:Flp pilus assembly pilin Flp
MILYSLIAAAVSAQIAAFLVAVSYALGAPVEWGFTARTAITWGALWPITVGALVYRWRRG